MTGHVTWRELISQPDAWKALLGRLESGALALPFAVEDFDEFILLGSGTSYYLALSVADWMRRRGLNARAIPSCEVLLDEYETRPSAARRLAIGFSRSGYSSELILANRALKAAGFRLLGISCTEESDLLNEADHGLLISEGYEDGLVMLRSFSTMLITAQYLFGTAKDRKALVKLPASGRAALAFEGPLSALANARPYDRFVFLASGPSHPLALEAALKIQEMAIATSEAYHSLDYRHGPKACADENTAVVLFALSERDHGLALARDIKALGASVIVIGHDAAAYADIAELACPVSDMDDATGAAAVLLPAQIFAYATALRRDQNPDAPVNLSKVVMF
ncbi:SIS domain-containing protein [Abyssibius alkaniclasticus]|uniref:SIS domain-containing protein n=1 Tax=Abyssibius alkaniclasticus TaxID=2881234 RepID=UPI0023643B9E|nr:SIS domain-containing protein [Abyssibius alkaniclasticus]UPH72228.1 SIS domain-containing protein [Abyssibius alkaniclasticus]